MSFSAESAVERFSQIKSPELWDLAHQIGAFIQYWGFKHVHGRIWAHLYLSQRPLDATDIRKRLGISKALVSLSVRDLMAYAVIREVGKSERGTILYEANPDIKEAIYTVMRSREKKMLSQILASQQSLQQLNPEALNALEIQKERLESLGEFISAGHGALDFLLNSQELNEETMTAFLMQGPLRSS
jgi:DNA-binding transcriptional regulator GbsR (MarR family)